MNTAERLHRNSQLSVPLAITEAIRPYMPELNKGLVHRKPKDKAKIVAPVTQEMEMIKGPDDPFQKTNTAKTDKM